MKAKTRNTHTNRILSTVGLLVLAVTIGYGQGLLAESAMKLFKNNLVVKENTSDFIFVNNTEEKDSFSFKNLFAETFQNRFEREIEASELESSHVTRTIIASAVEINFESDLETEQWMITPLSNNIERDLTAENWMTESFTESIESDLTAENWMTESFTESIESDLAVENWMAEPFADSVEGYVTVENWMTESFTESIESELEVEDWMIASLTAN